MYRDVDDQLRTWFNRRGTRPVYDAFMQSILQLRHYKKVTEHYMVKHKLKEFETMNRIDRRLDYAERKVVKWTEK